MAAIWLLLACFYMNAVLPGVRGKTDYYEVLGVTRSASNKDIKDSYKKLVKEWHPDKNRSPEAAQRFMEITEAYEVLSDEAARRRYDNRGSSYFGFDDPFNIVITPFSRRRTFKSRVDVINSDVFFNTVLPASHSKPYLLYFYSDFDCFLCLNMDTVWDRMKKEPSLSGVGMATLSTRTMDVLNFVGVVDVPTIVSVVDERFQFYQHIHYPSVTGVTQFLTSTLPRNIFTAVQADNLASFLGAAVLSNKPRLIIISPKPHPQLHHLLVAMKYRHFIAFGFVSTAKGRNAAVTQHLGVLGEEEAGIVFKESSQNVAGRSSTETSELFRFAKKHTLLELPRISSPEHFKAVCSTKQTSGCLVLVVSGPAHYSSNRVHSWRSLHTSQPKAYIDASWQSTFLQSMNFTPAASVTCDDGESAWKVFGFRWQQPSVVFSFSWMEWCSEMGPAHQWTVAEAGNGEGDPSYLLDDENGPGILQRLWLKCETWLMRSSNSLQAFALAYPQVLMSLVMMVPFLCMLTLRQPEPLPDHHHDHQQQWPTVKEQEENFLGFSDSPSEEHESEEESS